MVSNPSPEIKLTALGDEPRPLEEWLTTFHLASVVLDPYTNESSWVLKPALRILDALRGSSARVNLVVTASAADARKFLGPIADEILVFADPDRELVKGLGLDKLPAFVFIRIDGTVQASTEGWNAEAWHQVASKIAEATAWLAPDEFSPSDPGPFHGTPALG